jgi:hypothetical protein
MSLDQRDTKDLKAALAKGELAPRKRAFVQEILRRREGSTGVRYAWLGAIIAGFGILGALVTGWRLRGHGKT